MAFVYPAFLWALFALAIPVLIHLFQLRRFKRIDFPNVRFLAEVSLQTRARKKIQHWLVLLARLLAITCLVLAFAQPFIPSTSATTTAGDRAISLYIDDSNSMDGLGPQGRSLDVARTAARDVVSNQGPTAQFQVLTGRFDGREQLLMGRDEALEASSQVTIGAYTRPLSQVITRQREALARSEAPVKRAYILTDLQRSITDVAQWTNDSTIPTIIVPIQANDRENLSIDSVWFQDPVRRNGQRESLVVRISNRGEQELINVPLRLLVNGQQRAMATFSLAGGTTADTTLRFTNERGGLHWGEVTLDDAPIVFDDRMFIAYPVIDRLNVLLIGGRDAESDADITRVFADDSTHAWTFLDARSVDPSAIARQDLVVLNALPDVTSGLGQALATFVEAGGSVVLFPPAATDPTGYADLLTRFAAGATAHGDTTTVKVDRIDLEKPFYRDIFSSMPRNVDLPTVRERWDLRVPPGSDALLRMQDGSVLLAAVRRERGTVYLCATPLEISASNFTRHGLFAATLLRMAELSRPSGALYHTVGSATLLPVDGLEFGPDEVPHLRGPDGVDLIPELRRAGGVTQLVLHDQDLPDGHYALTVEADTLRMLALNLDRAESDLGHLTVEELKAQLELQGLNTFSVLEATGDELSLRLAELDQGRKLWKWFILFALIFLLSEVLLIRYLR
jgi:hypothetical protein